MKSLFANPLLKLLTACIGVLFALQSFSQSPAGSASGSSSKEVPLQIIVVESPADAKDILDRLKRGDDFAVLAKEKSTDSTGDSGGYMGSMDPAMLRAELRDALTGVEPGHFTGIAHIPEGYAILKVLSPHQLTETENLSRNRQAEITALKAPGSIRYTPNVSGIGEAESAFFRYPKPPGWGQDLQQTCQTRNDSLANATKKMEDLSGAKEKEIMSI